jgi:hypothetical protein
VAAAVAPCDVAPAPPHLYFAPAPAPLLLVLLRFALGFGQLTIFHINQQAFSLQLRNEVQFQSQNEKTELRSVFFDQF